MIMWFVDKLGGIRRARGRLGGKAVIGPGAPRGPGEGEADEAALIAPAPRPIGVAVSRPSSGAALVVERRGFIRRQGAAGVVELGQAGIGRTGHRESTSYLLRELSHDNVVSATGKGYTRIGMMM
jgi:hypothetical protein